MTDHSRAARAPRQRGFTLVEILVVIAIVGMLVGFVGPRVFDLFAGAQEDHARNEVKNILRTVETYVMQTQDYSPTLDKLVQPDNKGKTWLDGQEGQVPKDPWGTPYELRPAERRGKWVVISAGPDKTLETDDDIRSDKGKDTESR